MCAYSKELAEALRFTEKYYGDPVKAKAKEFFSEYKTVTQDMLNIAMPKGLPKEVSPEFLTRTYLPLSATGYLGHLTTKHPHHHIYFKYLYTTLPIIFS